MKKLIILAIAVAVISIMAIPATLFADTVEGFVCPVISTENVLNSPNGAMIGQGNYTIIGPNVTVGSYKATNGEGTGTPPGPHSEPGDKDYTAIWAHQD